MEEFYLVNGKILDVRTGKFIKADLKITGKQIASVQEKASTEAKKVDCSGKYLIPGIMDAHVHLVWEGTAKDPMYETVRDGNYLNFAKGVSSAEKS